MALRSCGPRIEMPSPGDPRSPYDLWWFESRSTIGGPSPICCLYLWLCLPHQDWITIFGVVLRVGGPKGALACVRAGGAQQHGIADGRHTWTHRVDLNKKAPARWSTRAKISGRMISY